MGKDDSRQELRVWSWNESNVYLKVALCIVLYRYPQRKKNSYTMKLKWFFMIFEWSSAQYPTKIGPSPVLSITRITSPRSELKTKMALTWSREWGFWCSVMSDMWETRKWEMRTNIIFFQISCQNGIVYLWHHYYWGECECVFVFTVCALQVAGN